MKQIYNGREYAIYHIEKSDEDEQGDEVEQYKVFIKEVCKAKRPQDHIDRDCYSQMENGIEYAHEMARETIAQYFIKPSK